MKSGSINTTGEFYFGIFEEKLIGFYNNSRVPSSNMKAFFSTSCL